MDASRLCLLYLPIISFCDLRTRKIPDSMTAGFLAIALLRDVFLLPSGIFQNLVCAAFFSSMFLGVAAVTKGLGMGDVKLAFAIGYCAGFVRTSIIFIAACIIGILFILVGRFLRKKVDRIPFAPFVTAGYVVSALFCGRSL